MVRSPQGSQDSLGQERNVTYASRTSNCFSKKERTSSIRNVALQCCDGSSVWYTLLLKDAASGKTTCFTHALKILQIPFIEMDAFLCISILCSASLYEACASGSGLPAKEYPSLIAQALPSFEKNKGDFTLALKNRNYL